MLNNDRKRFARKLATILNRVIENRDEFTITIERNVAQEKMTLVNGNKKLHFLKHNRIARLSGEVYYNWFMVPDKDLCVPLNGIMHVTENENVSIARLLEDISNGENSFEEACKQVEGFLD